MRLLEIAAETARLLAAVDASAQPRLLELAKEYKQLIQVHLANFKVFVSRPMSENSSWQEIYSELSPLAGGQSSGMPDASDMIQ